MIQKKKIIKCLFIVLIMASVLYNAVFANEAKVYFENEQTIDETIDSESVYSVDIFAEVENKVISGFQFQLVYPENLELMDVEQGDIENVQINKYGKKVIGYNKNSATNSNEKVKLCTLYFNVIEESEDGKYDIKIDFSNEYTKLIDSEDNKIEIKNSGNEEENGENKNSENDGSSSEEGSKNNSGDSNTGKNAGIQVVENKEEEDRKAKFLPQTGGNIYVIIIDIVLIAFTLLFGFKLLKYKKYGV